MTKLNFRPISPRDVDDSALERVNDRLGVPTMVRSPAKRLPADTATASRQTAAPPRRQQKLTVRIPGYLVDELKRIKSQGVTMIWIEHVVHALLSIADRLLVINFGRMLAEGEPQAVMADPEVRRVYMGMEG